MGSLGKGGRGSSAGKRAPLVGLPAPPGRGQRSPQPPRPPQPRDGPGTQPLSLQRATSGNATRGRCPAPPPRPQVLGMPGGVPSRATPPATAVTPEDAGPQVLLPCSASCPAVSLPHHCSPPRLQRTRRLPSAVPPKPRNSGCPRQQRSLLQSQLPFGLLRLPWGEWGCSCGAAAPVLGVAASAWLLLHPCTQQCLGEVQC